MRDATANVLNHPRRADFLTATSVVRGPNVALHNDP